MGSTFQAVNTRSYWGRIDRGSWLFFGGLLAASLLPPVLLIILSGPLAKHPSAQATYYALWLVGVSDVGLSTLFWIDQRYREIMRAAPRHYYRDIALFAIAALVSVMTFGAPFFGFFVVLFAALTLHHFARQNWGILCLTASATGSPRPCRAERFSCHIAALGGLIGILPDVANIFLPEGATHLGLVLSLGSCAASLWFAAAQLRARLHPLRVAMTIAIGGFFVPVHFTGPVLGAVIIGVVHGVQYAIIMGVLAADARQGSRTVRIGGVALLTAAYLALYDGVADPANTGAWVMPAMVLLYSLAVWHYLIDAGVWRMNRPAQRRAAGESFPFLFAAARVSPSEMISTAGRHG
jgi:hypothetical protein